MTTQSEKSYADDFAKAKSRELVRDMIGRHPKAKYFPHKMNVLFLPGVDAAEVFQVYDPLGIPRANLVGIEREKEVYQELRRKNLGIQLVHSTLEDYIASRKGFNFDVLSFDFVGPTTSLQRTSLCGLLGKSRGSDIIVHVANQIRRDGPISRSNYLTGDVLSKNDLVTSMIRQGDHEFIGNILDFICKSDDDYKENRFDVKRRGDSYSQLLLEAATLEENPNRFFEELYHFSTGRNLDEFAKLVREQYKSELGAEMSDDELFNNYLFGATIQKTSMNSLMKFLKSNFPEFNDDAVEVGATAIATTFSTKRNYLPLALKRYSYISESGCPMIGDVVHYKHPEQMFNSAKMFARQIGFPNKLEVVNRSKALQFAQQYFDAVNEYGSKRSVDFGNLPERIFLGNSAKPVLTKQRAIEEFRAGSSVDEIKTKYRGVNGKPLSQWRAHFTMGTYNERTVETEEKEEVVIDSEDSDLEKITREDAIDLLSSGIPAEEINSAYPTSFTLRQLRAYQAHITMGSYENNGNMEGRK